VNKSRDWNLAILGALIALIAILIARAVWSDSDRMLEQAKADYVLCLEEAGQAFDPVEATSQCEQDWQEAQNAYYIP
jgi:hypothetical protein